MAGLLAGLNEAQKAAVTSPAAVLQVLAPPGSGKTKTLTARVVWLITHNGLAAKDIIVCTFTVKAAREMGDRLCTALPPGIGKCLVLGTFHSIARRLLVKFGKHIGLDPKFGIADSSDQASILARIIKRHAFTFKPAQVRSRISGLKATFVTAEQFVASGKPLVERQEFGIVYSEYEEHLRSTGLLDYDDLLLRCTDLLRAYPLCVSHIRAVLIDEFQDTNNVQYELMQLFAQAQNNITVVGDPDQSIYGWRSADMKNLTKMQSKYPDTHVATLEENYRSGGAILLSAQEIIEQDDSRPAKRLMPTHSVGVQPVLRKLRLAKDEAQWMVSEIQRISTLSGALFDWNDFAVLLRSASLSRLIESAFVGAGIPYRMVGGHRFFDRVEVKLILDYLRVIDHPGHNDAVARVVNVPPRSVGATTINDLLEEANERKMTLWKLLRDVSKGGISARTKLVPETVRGIDKFTGLIVEMRNKVNQEAAQSSTLVEFLRLVIRKAGIEQHLRKTKAEDFDTRWANIEELIAQASDVVPGSDAEPDVESILEEQVAPVDLLSQFLANVALSTEARDVDDDGQRKSQVTLSTIHAAKGLEWPVVFIPAAYQGSIPHSRAEDNGRRATFAVRCYDASSSHALSELPAEEFDGRLDFRISVS